MSELDGTYGLDVSASPDLDPMLRLQGGPRVLAEAIVRRLSTPRGGLWYAPDYGFDVRELLGEGFTPAALFRAQSSIEAEVEKDARVQSARVTLTTPAPDKLRISIRIVAADAPFDLVVGVDALNVELLRTENE